MECYLDLLAVLHSDDQHGVRFRTLTVTFHAWCELIIYMDRICSTLYLRCTLKSLPCRGCQSFTWKLVLPCSWPSGLLIAWCCVMKSSAWHESCCQRSWCWKTQDKNLRLRPGLLVQRVMRGSGCYSGLGLPTSFRVTATFTWKTGNKQWQNTQGVVEPLVLLFVLWF